MLIVVFALDDTARPANHRFSTARSRRNGPERRRPAPVLLGYAGAGLPPVWLGRFFAVLCSRRGAGCLFVPAAEGCRKARAISSRLLGGDDRVFVVATGMETIMAPWRAARWLELNAAVRRSVMQRGSRCPGHGPDPAKSAMHLSWAGDGPVMGLPYACAGDAEAERSGQHRRRASRSNRYGHIADSVRAEGAVRGTLALPIRARFVPLHGHPDCLPGWCLPCIPGGRFLRRSAGAGRQAGLVRARSRGGQPDQPAPSGVHVGGRSRTNCTSSRPHHRVLAGHG